MEKIELKIVGISTSELQKEAFALILKDTSSERSIPIIIGSYEALAIARELESFTPERPLTHDLFKSMALSYDIIVTEVNINHFSEGIFYAQISLDNGTKTNIIDARTSDAVAIALRFRAPIYTNQKVLEAAGIHPSEIPIPEKENISEVDNTNYAHFTDPKLTDLLSDAIRKEDYEAASLIRDELNKRKK